MKEKKQIVDTTLRDGEQCPGIAFQPEDKYQLAMALDNLGVYEMEVGIAGAGCEDFRSFHKIMSDKKQAKASLWCRMNPIDVEEACRMQPDLIHMGVPVSYVQIYSKLKKNKAWVQKEIFSCLEVIHRFDVPVTIGLEDSTRADVGFILNLMKQLVKEGVSTVRIADTVGILTPDRAESFMREIKSVDLDMKIEIHEHNDLGMAVANSLLMAKAGGDIIDCTLLGLGERVGNCNLYDFVQAGEKIFQLDLEKNLIREAEKMLISILNRGI